MQTHLLHHLHWRSGFGPDPRVVYGDYESEVLKLFSATTLPDLSIPGWAPLSVDEVRSMSEEKRKEYQKKERQARLQLGYVWFTKMTESAIPFPEKMAFFWSGHFACRVNSAQFGLRYVNTLRRYALGNFGDLLRAMIRDAALLQFLNNNQNKKGNPNENFAREFFELFTLGRGNYTEQDVREAARALTGWGFERDGSFELREPLHDNGTKTIFGKSGNFDGDDLVDLVLARKECAMFISYKLCRFFQSDAPDITLIRQLADELFITGYNLTSAMQFLFKSAQFKSEESIGSKIKSPVELIAGMARMFDIKFEKQTALLQLQRALGQVLLNPPNVAGWPGGKSWIDSSTLLYRLRLPEVLLTDAETILDAKDEFDAQQLTSATGRKIKTTFNSAALQKYASGNTIVSAVNQLAGLMLQVQPEASVAKLVEQHSVSSDKSSTVLKAAIRIMSLPEYQLC